MGKGRWDGEYVSRGVPNSLSLWERAGVRVRSRRFQYLEVGE
jgi:hypothetical protein